MTEIKKNVEVVSLVFQSVPYLHFIANEFKSELCKVDGWDVGVRIVANDATPEVLEELPKLGVPYTIYNNPDPNEFYLNRVYGAYNHSITSSEYDNIVLLNSDMMFSSGALANLLKHHDGTNIPCSRLVESGKMPSGMHGVNLGDNHFGRHPNEFNFEGWEKWAEEHKEDRTEPNGLYMPCLFEKKRVEEAGLYPRGNIFVDGDKLVCGYPNDRPVYMAADDFFFHKIMEPKYGMKQITVFDSLVYHIQEGEKDE
tara:strand:+ start:4162 stop:4926 length:765 start_codon:yes stop_codon:yes gene_type:complete